MWWGGRVWEGSAQSFSGFSDRAVAGQAPTARDCAKLEARVRVGVNTFLRLLDPPR